MIMYIIINFSKCFYCLKMYFKFLLLENGVFLKYLNNKDDMKWCFLKI